jgi:hypothetical protein
LTTPHRQARAWNGAARWTTVAPVTLVAATVALAFAWLRETPIFWTNAGGYPIWLRDTVAAGFYPVWAASFAGTGWLVMTAGAAHPLTQAVARRRFLWILLLVSLWLATAICIGYDNIFDARPISGSS